MTELERTKAALKVAMDHLEYSADIIAGHERCLAEVNAILNPPPEYEDVPVERWALHDKHGNFICTCEIEPSLNKGEQSIRLPYTVRREKRVPKEMSVTVEAHIKGNGLIPFYPFADTAAVGRTVQLTATWQEEP